MTELLGAPPVGEETEMTITFVPLEDGGIELVKIGDVIIPTEDVEEMEDMEDETGAPPETIAEMVGRTMKEE